MTDEEDLVAAAARDSDRSYLSPEVVRQRMRTLELLAPAAGESVLDAGCGVGLLSEPLALEVGARGALVGVDITDEVLEKARARCADLAQAEFMTGDLTALPLDDARFDAAACTQVLLYVGDVPKALAELHRVLKPGGRLVIVETDWSGTILNSADQGLTREMIGSWDKAVASPNLPARLRPLLENAGFSNTRVEALPVLRTSTTPNDFVSSIIAWFAKTAPQHSAVSEHQAQAWHADIQRLSDEGAFFFCVNRFLFSAVKR